MKISSETRELVRRRAQDACEYCHLPQEASILPHQVDHKGTAQVVSQFRAAKHLAGFVVVPTTTQAHLRSSCWFAAPTATIRRPREPLQGAWPPESFAERVTGAVTRTLGPCSTSSCGPSR